MILLILSNILPTFLILLIIFVIAKIVTNVKNRMVYVSFLAGIITVIPALCFIKVLGIFITIIIPIALPLIFFQFLSSLSEEFFKYLSIKFFTNEKHKTLLSIFVGGGFALCETLYLTIGTSNMGLIRTYTTLPLHIITSILLSKSINNKRFFLLSLLIHISYNLLITNVYY